MEKKEANSSSSSPIATVYIVSKYYSWRFSLSLRANATCFKLK